MRRAGIMLLGWAAALAAAAGPYAPEAGAPGTTALHASTNLFVAWASGWVDYVPGGNEAGGDTYPFDPQWQHPEQALGPADAVDPDNATPVVSLGGGGRITLSFDRPIADGPGPDFAVFENGTAVGFHELAFVEVSSDGTNFFRFPAVSLTADPVDAYIGANWVDPTDVHHLASKYVAGYGTPFDLADLAPLFPALDTGKVRWVRLVDIVGDGRETDSEDRPIYDPYPTVGSPGFDLDAVGVIHVPTPCSVEVGPGGAAVHFETVSNRVFQVEATDALAPADWRPLGAAVAGDGQWHAVPDPAAAGIPQRFYRVVRSLPPEAGP